MFFELCWLSKHVSHPLLSNDATSWIQAGIGWLLVIVGFAVAIGVYLKQQSDSVESYRREQIDKNNEEIRSTIDMLKGVLDGMTKWSDMHFDSKLMTIRFYET